MRKRWLEKSWENNLTIALRLLYAKKEKIYPDYVSRFNSEREKQVVFFIIPNGDVWHYLAMKKVLFRGITSMSSMSAILPFKNIKYKHYVYRSKDCMKKFCESLREHAIKIINFIKKKWGY